MVPHMLFSLLPLAAQVLAKGHIQRHKRHGNEGLEGSMKWSGQELTERAHAWNENSTSLEKRGSSGRATFYDVGLGSCGEYNSDSEFVVALNVPQYGSPNSVSKYCFKWVTINYGGKSAKAQIVDCCPGCPWGALDMSPSLFKHFANPDMGIFYMNWNMAGEDSGDDEPKTTKKSSTSQWQPSPTSSSTQWQQTTSSTTSSFSSSASANATISSSSSLNATSTGLPVIPAEQLEFAEGNLNNFNQLFLAFSGLSSSIARIGKASSPKL